MSFSWFSTVFNYDFFWRSMNGEFVDVDVMWYVALGLSFYTSFIGSGKVRVRLADFVHLAAGSVWPDWVLSESRKKGWVRPERRDSPLRLL